MVVEVNYNGKFISLDYSPVLNSNLINPCSKCIKIIGKDIRYLNHPSLKEYDEIWKDVENQAQINLIENAISKINGKSLKGIVGIKQNIYYDKKCKLVIFLKGTAVF